MKTIHRLVQMKTMVFQHVHMIRKSQLTKKTGKFDVLECLDWVNIVAINKNSEIVLVKQYRHGTDEITIEIPGGAVEPNEDMLIAAKRELLEETGHSSNNWHYLGEVTPNPAFISNRCQTYLALDCEKTHELNLDPFEEIELLYVEKSKLDEMVSSGEIHHSLVIAALHYYHLFKNKLK